MPDNLSRIRPEDSAKINVHQDWEVTYWTQQLGVSKAVLLSAVRAVGPMVKDVKQWLRQNGY